jgi:hypothetical protein
VDRVPLEIPMQIRTVSLTWRSNSFKLPPVSKVDRTWVYSAPTIKMAEKIWEKKMHVNDERRR